MLFGLTKIFSQDILLQDFKTKDFGLKYPKKFKIDSADKKYSFYYDTRLGDITISVYETQKMTAKELKQMLLDINETKEKNPDIQLTNTSGTMTCFYKYTFDKVKYFIKAIQNDKKMYLISLNWNEDSWETFKETLLKSFDSFNPK